MRGKLIAPGALALVLAACGGGDKGVKVPEVVGRGALDAGRVLEQVGLSPRFDPKPVLPTKCTVTGQSERGRVPPGSEIVLRLSCPNRG